MNKKILYLCSILVICGLSFPSYAEQANSLDINLEQANSLDINLEQVDDLDINPEQVDDLDTNPEQQYNDFYTNYMYENYLKDKTPRHRKSNIPNIVVQTRKDPLFQVNNNNLSQLATYKVNGNNTLAQSDTSQKAKEAYVDTSSGYLEFGVGISELGDYKVSQIPYDLDKANMRPNSASISIFLKYGFVDFFINNLNLELESTYTNFDNITTDNENNTTLLDYNQKVKILTGGTNLIYNILDRSNKIIPFVGLGGGIAQFEVSDFGIVRTKDGNIDLTGQATAFKSKTEKEKVAYGKAMLGVNFNVNPNSSFVLSGEYIWYDDVKLKYLTLNKLNNISLSGKLRFYF